MKPDNKDGGIEQRKIRNGNRTRRVFIQFVYTYNVIRVYLHAHNMVYYNIMYVTYGFLCKNARACDSNSSSSRRIIVIIL